MHNSSWGEHLMTEWRNRFRMNARNYRLNCQVEILPIVQSFFLNNLSFFSILSISNKVPHFFNCYIFLKSYH